ncbi:LptF/LptG family permease [Candidatus Dependentiae bacterium]|nr:LptF/LptG family permease [Candidatus Dependentiae bacterium]
MTLAWYVSRLFVAAWASITLLLAFLFNFIEFFEKLARVKQVSVAHIMHFLWLNFLPSAFDVMPISAWLATLFVLRELTTQQSWDFLQLIGFIPRRMALLITKLTLCIVLTTGIIREAYVLHIAQQAEHFKYAYFKKQQQDLIFNTWFELEGNRFCYIEELDYATLSGKGVILVTLTPERTVKAVMHAMQVKLEPQAHAMHVHQPVTVHLPEQQVVREAASIIQTRYFFTVMRMKQRVYHIPYLYKALLFSAYLPKHTVRMLQQHLIDSLWYYASLIGYPLLTIYAFNAPLSLLWRWGLAFLPYPTLLVGGLLARRMLIGDIGLLVLIMLIFFLFELFLRKKRLLVAFLSGNIFKP